MPTAVDGNEFNFRFGAIAPEDLLDANFVCQGGQVRFGRADDIVEIRKILTRVSRRADVSALVEQAEEIDLSTVEWDQGILGTVHDHDGSTLPDGLAFG